MSGSDARALMRTMGAPAVQLVRSWQPLIFTICLLFIWRNQTQEIGEVRGLRKLLEVQKDRTPSGSLQGGTGVVVEAVREDKGLASTRRQLVGVRDLRDCKPRQVGGRAGDNYGAWTLCVDDLEAGSIVYSFGIGGDVSFDDAMVEAGFQVFGFDPTVTQQQVKGMFMRDHGRRGIPSRFHFSQIGLATEDGVVPFLKHKNPKISSMTAVSTGLTANYKRDEVFEAPVLRLQTIMGSQPHKWVDVLKIDIEGVEFDVFLSEDFSAMPTLPTDQILIEFHDRLVADGKSKHEKVKRLLESKGFHLRWAARNNQEALFVRTKPRMFFLPSKTRLS